VRRGAPERLGRLQREILVYVKSTTPEELKRLYEMRRWLTNPDYHPHDRTTFRRALAGALRKGLVTYTDEDRWNPAFVLTDKGRTVLELSRWWERVDDDDTRWRQRRASRAIRKVPTAKRGTTPTSRKRTVLKATAAAREPSRAIRTPRRLVKS